LRNDVRYKQIIIYFRFLLLANIGVVE
jgi:hypothetical protein